MKEYNTIGKIFIVISVLSIILWIAFSCWKLNQIIEQDNKTTNIQQIK